MIDPRKIAQESGFHDKLADETDTDKIDIQKYFASPTAIEYQYAFSTLGNIKGKKILDLGCGFGEASIFFALGKAEVTALDISPKMLDNVKNISKRYKVEEKIKTLKAPAEKIPLPSESFDLIYGASILHHLELTTAAWEIKRLLRKNGKAVFIEPLGYNPLINVYRRMSKNLRTKTEKPLTFKEVNSFNSIFATVSHKEFHLFTTLIFLWFYFIEKLDPNKVRYWRRFIEEGEKYAKAFRMLNFIDQVILKFPLLKRFCWSTVIVLRKDK